MENLIYALAFFGGLYVFHELIKQLKCFYYRFISSPVSPTEYGSVVVITGATDGIGKSLAFSFASKGMNLLLISRTQTKLDAVKSELIQKYGNVQVDTLEVDFNKFSIDDDGGRRVRKMFDLYGEKLGILINNVGVSYDYPMFFHELSNDRISELISLNVSSTTFMTRLFLENVLRKQSSKTPKGCIVNIGSFAGIFPSPLLSEYSATKCYVESLTKSLHYEYSSQGVHFQCHVPLYIVSKLSKFKKPTLFIPSSDEYANSVVNNLGKDIIVSGHFLQSIATELLKFAPRRMLMKQIKTMHLNIRKKALEKIEREKNPNTISNKKLN